MTPHCARIFFYGSFINPDVLARVDIVPHHMDVVRLWGFELRIEPLANLVPSDRACAYGIVTELTHPQLERLYGQDWVGEYHPYAVVVETRTGQLIPALCYISSDAERSPAADDYIDRIVGPARSLGFPGWYIERIDSFRPAQLPGK